MVGQDVVHILGRPAFHDLALTSSGALSYLGPQWRRDIAFAGNNVAMQGDISAGKMIFGVEGVDPERRDRLIKMLDVDLTWRLNRVSDGQRRRVQIAMGLLKPYQARRGKRGATIVYATHIFDGLERWPTHLAYVEDGRLLRGGPVAGVPELQQGRKLLHVVERWLRMEKEERLQRQRQQQGQGQQPAAAAPPRQQRTLMPSKHMAFFRS
eukprot:scaffold5.g629.t1